MRLNASNYRQQVDQARLDAVIAFYEGLFLTPAPENEIRNQIAEVRREMGD